MVFLLRILLMIPVMAVLLWLAIANPQTILFVWSPLHDAQDMPLAGIVLASVALGFLWGGLMVWLNTLKLYQDRAQQRKTIRRLEKDLYSANENALKSAGVVITGPTSRPKTGQTLPDRILGR